MTDERPIALLITPVLPYHTGSGRALRAWGWLTELAKTHRVHVVVTSESQIPDVGADYPAAGIHRLTSSAKPGRRWPLRLGLVFPFLAALSRRFVTDWLWIDSDAARQACETIPADVRRIVVFQLYLHDVAQTFVNAFPSASIDLDIDDVGSATRASIAGAQFRMRRYYEAIRGMSVAVQYWLVERTLDYRYSRAYLAADEDCRRVPPRLAVEVGCRPNRIPLARDSSPMERKNGFSLLFVGILNYPPNEEAVEWLVSVCLPLLKQKLPVAPELAIVGRQASPHIRQAAGRNSGIRVCENAEELDEWYRGADAVLVPLFSGGGTKLKAIECLAHRRPLVSTAHGVRGLGLKDGINYINAESPAQFAAAVLRLFNDPCFAERIADAGWDYCAEKFQLQ